MSLGLDPFSYWSEDDQSIHVEFMSEWRAAFPRFRIYGEAEVVPLLMRHFPEHFDVYQDIRIPTAKSDIALLLLLFEYGGLYIDCHCGIRNADEIRLLLDLLNSFDGIFVDRAMAQEPRNPDEHLVINSMMFCRPQTLLIYDMCRQALLNLSRQRVLERRNGFTSYCIWSLTGPGLVTASLFEPASANRDVRKALRGRINIIREEVAPISRNRHRAYSELEPHWSVRQQTELLFEADADNLCEELGDEDIRISLETAERPDLLRELFDTSRRAFGVNFRHYPHTINYPWILSRLETLPLESRVLDIGAGVSPLPVRLAEMGMFVDSVDNSDIIRTLPPSSDWNEWGFFDYGTLHRNIASHNCSAIEFQPWRRFDAIYSASSMAHFPSLARKGTLAMCWNWLKLGGRLVLTIDLIPNTDSIWNLGGSDETADQHGTYRDVERELSGLGFNIDESRVLRDVRRSSTDLWFLLAHKPSSASTG